jgi:hypothetical protein
MYDLNQFGGDVVVPIINVHPNPYYVDTKYLGADDVGPSSVRNGTRE